MTRSVARLRSSIVAKLALFVAGVVVLATTAMSALGFRFAREILTEQIHRRLEVVADSSEKRLHAYVAQQSERVALVASRTRLRRYLEQRPDGSVATSDFRAGTGRILRDAETSAEEILRIAIADGEGRVFAASADEELGRDYAGDPGYPPGREASHLGVPYRRDGRWLARLTTPVRSNAGRFLGVAIVEFDLRGLGAILADRSGLGDTGEVLVASDEGDALRYLIPPLAAPERRSIAAPRAAAMSRGIAGGRGRAVEDYDGRRVLATWRPLRYQDPELRRWGLVVKMDAAEAYAPVDRLRDLQLSASLAAVVLSAWLALLVARRFTRPMLAVAGAADRIGEGDLDARVETQATDELGRLPAAFNHMADEVRESRSLLEQRVEERTVDLTAANQELETRNAQLDEFAYGASHDLKAPLRSVRTLASCVAGDLGDEVPPESKSHLELMQRRLRRMENLLDDLLEYSHAGRVLGEIGEVDTGEVARDAADLQAPPEGFQVRVDPAMPTLATFRAPLAQVFRNLIGNAIKHRGPDGRCVRVRATDAGAFVEFSVADDGPGIPPEFHDRIFSMFQTLQSRDRVEGSGMGLAIVQRAVERLGGRVGVESEPGCGTTFRFTWPKSIDR